MGRGKIILILGSAVSTGVPIDSDPCGRIIGLLSYTTEHMAGLCSPSGRGMKLQILVPPRFSAVRTSILLQA